jgi:hypothetical protein
MESSWTSHKIHKFGWGAAKESPHGLHNSMWTPCGFHANTMEGAKSSIMACPNWLKIKNLRKRHNNLRMDKVFSGDY